MKKLIAMLMVAALLAACTAALAESVKFTGSAYVYEKIGSGKTSTIISRGSIAEKVSTSKNGKWTKVKYAGGEGWVRTQYVKATGKEGSVKYGSGGRKSTVAKDGPAVSGKVKASGNVKIRDNGCLSSRVIGTLEKGKTAKLTGKSKIDSRGVTFYEIKYNGKTGWVSSNYAKIVK